MSDPHAMQRLCGLMRKAVQDYEMISPGDKIMVGVSGGKDSVALTIGLAQLRRYLGFDYEVVAVTLDPQFAHQAVDYSPLAALFARYEVPYEVRRTEIGPIVFEYRQEKNPCSLCARLRRGALHTAAQELGCSPKLAFFKVVIPEIMPGMVSGFLMAFTYSLDDFVISYFVSSASSQTLPVTIFSMVRKRVSPEINALTAIIFVVVLALLLLSNYYSARKEKQMMRKEEPEA